MQEYFPNVYEVVRILKEVYGDFNHHNLRNPLDELIFIICSVRTEEYNYLYTYQAIKDKYHTFKELLAASEEEVAEKIKFGGLSKIKARDIKKILTTIDQEFGTPTLDPLQTMDDATCENFLVSLPGVGMKTARCVMMYSLDRQVFPVDTHVWRIARRLGWNKADYAYSKRKSSDMNTLQEGVPPELRYSLHVNFVSHGRKICTFTNPKCSTCPILQYCPRIGVEKHK